MTRSDIRTARRATTQTVLAQAEELSRGGQGVTGELEEVMKNRFQRVPYKLLNSRQQEAYNFQKVSAVLADYGFLTIRLSSDWRGADFIAQHIDGVIFLKVQLKGRLTFEKKYMGRDLHVCFPERAQWFLYPHDELLDRILEDTGVATTVSWMQHGGYSFPRLSKRIRALLAPYRLEG